MAKNVHKIPKKQWNKWGIDGQAAFNRMWSYVTPELLPPSLKPSKLEFSVLRWNVCWVAADMVREWRGTWYENHSKKGAQ